MGVTRKTPKATSTIEEVATVNEKQAHPQCVLEVEDTARVRERDLVSVTCDVERKVLYLIDTGVDQDTSSLSCALWNTMCPDVDVVTMSVPDYYSAMVEFIADEHSPSVALFVPALTIPVSSVSIGDLEVLKSFALNPDRSVELDELDKATRGMYRMMGKSDYIPRELPIVYDKMKLAEMIAKFDISDDTVNIPTLYASFVNRSVPFDASIATSKITGLVARSNPNMDVVGDYIGQRKFIITTAEGFEAIKEQLSRLLL